MPTNPSDSSRTTDRATPSPRVLIVDDELGVRAALSRFFARRGWVVVEALDGECARGLLEPNETNAFDLVICDLRMPRFSGCDFYRWLAERHPEAVGKLVFTTGDAFGAESAAFLREARRPVLEKPFELCELDRIVDEIRAA